MKCSTCGSTQGTFTDLVVIDSFAAAVEEDGVTQGSPKWCTPCSKSLKAEMETWFQKRKEQLRPKTSTRL